MAKLFAVSISSLRLFQSRLPLNCNEFVPNLCDLAGRSLQSILLLNSYSTTFLVKRSQIYGGFKWLVVLYISTIRFCNFFCELSKLHVFTRVHQSPLRYHYCKLFSLHAWSFYLLKCLLLYHKTAISEGNIGNLTLRPYSVVIWFLFASVASQSRESAGLLIYFTANLFDA